MCQDTTDVRCLLTATGTSLLIESKGTVYNNGIWVFGQITYITDEV